MALRHAQFQAGDQVPGTVYRVEALIGSGGMGSVYRVEHSELGKQFVLKALHGHLSSRSDLVARLRNEWRALGRLDHPNIVQVTDAGQTSQGLPFYVMENLRGQTLGKMLAARGRLPVKLACEIICDVLCGLHAAHSTGAVHRDIKPPNIFVEEDGRAKLLDFGIAKLRDQSAKVVTAGGISIGTPRYMAPEQAEGTVVDGRADIYATALVLYEMVVGKGPFYQIRDPNELVLAHISREPERADHAQPHVPPELADLIQRWLSKSPGSRPLTAELAHRELRSLLEAFGGDATDHGEEVTLGGAYDASTLGAVPSSSAASSGAVSARTGSPENGLARGDGLGSGPTHEVTQAGAGIAEIAVTKTLAQSAAESAAHARGKPDHGSVKPSSGQSDPVGPAGTLGWGTSRDEMAPPTLGAIEAAGAGESQLVAQTKRRSVTPPPISATPGSHPGPGTSGRSSLRWVIATAVISFTLAFGVSKLMSGGQPGPQGETTASEPKPRSGSTSFGARAGGPPSERQPSTAGSAGPAEDAKLEATSPDSADRGSEDDGLQAHAPGAPSADPPTDTATAPTSSAKKPAPFPTAAAQSGTAAAQSGTAAAQGPQTNAPTSSAKKPAPAPRVRPPAPRGVRADSAAEGEGTALPGSGLW